MPIVAGWGELLVGAYHKRLNGCEVVSYNNRSEEAGNQMEADVIAIDNNQDFGEQNVYICEVVTHMRGNLYSGPPDDGWWTEYTNTKAYQYSLQKLEQKFQEDYRYVNDTFGDADNHFYQFWAPVVSGWQNGSDIIRGLHALTERFEERQEQISNSLSIKTILHGFRNSAKRRTEISVTTELLHSDSSKFWRI